LWITSKQSKFFQFVSNQPSPITVGLDAGPPIRQPTRSLPTPNASSSEILTNSCNDWLPICTILRMRMNLIIRPHTIFESGARTFPLTLTLRPSCGLPGEYELPINSVALLRLLRQQTDLPSTVIERFERTLHSPVGTRLLAVEMNDRTLTEIGYFID
jgi:hypothetical protein